MYSIRLDENPKEPLEVQAPDDGSTDEMYFRGAEDLIERFLKAKRVLVAATFFQQGERVFEFNVSGLRWPPPMKNKAKTH